MASNGKSVSPDIEFTFTDEESKVLKYIGVSETEVRDTIRILQDWIRQQPHLPECAELYRIGSDNNLTFLNVLVSNDRKMS
uniref:Uncharacterized protein n=1 Tax=Timema bartmani TaxID=61472 RepID=A0A7R9FDH6_9NEOP|nr:unnamed protein product [Timema bartmani]